MVKLTINLSDEDYRLLNKFARQHKTNIDQFMENLATDTIAEIRFNERASSGSIDEGLELLDKLDQEN